MKKMAFCVRSLEALRLVNLPMAVSISKRSMSRYVGTLHCNNYSNRGMSVWRNKAALGTTLMMGESCQSSPPSNSVDFSSASAVSMTNDKSMTFYPDNRLSQRRRLLGSYSNSTSLPLVTGCVFQQQVQIPLSISSAGSVRNYGQRRRKASIFREKQGHYEILGVTPHATQADVKAAYYRLSKLHHPDTQLQQQQNEAESKRQNQEKFSEINEAYSILGNVLLRRRYDRGILGPRDTAESVKKEAAVRTDSEVFRPPTDTKIYDFDEFYNQHYGASMAREKRARAERMKREADFIKEMEESKKQRLMPTMVVGLALLTFAVYFNKGKF